MRAVRREKREAGDRREAGWREEGRERGEGAIERWEGWSGGGEGRGGKEHGRESVLLS